jgi:hypothetical protein
MHGHPQLSSPGIVHVVLLNRPSLGMDVRPATSHHLNSCSSSDDVIVITRVKELKDAVRYSTSQE